MVNQCLFQLRLIKMLILRKVKKSQHIRIFDDLFVFRLRNRGLNFRCHTLFILARKYPVVEHGIYLP